MNVNYHINQDGIYQRQGMSRFLASPAFGDRATRFQDPGNHDTFLVE
jgi:hypothetical protein